MPPGCPTTPRVRADGKFFRLGESKFYLKGLTYGPFAPNADQEMFPSPAQTERDFGQIRKLGANVLRVYYVPPRWLLDLAARNDLKLFIDIPWPSHLCFLDSPSFRQQARDSVRRAVQQCRGHPAVFAYSVANEIPAEIVRWSGAARVQAFIDELVCVAKAGDPESLCTFTSFPPTEYLRAESVDFVSFNLYLHERAAFERYLARLQMLAETKPLVLAELGMDSWREGEARKCEFLSWQIESVFRRGLAGAVVFSFTDDWFRGGSQIEDWSFGVTTRDRCPKDSFHALQCAFVAAPRFPLSRYPKVSVVVASYNGAQTLRNCLTSLSRLNYPEYEVILVDDGSTDNTPEIAKEFPGVRSARHDQNRGLSAARNTGLALAAGEIIAFTDSDCRVDEDWLYYLVSDLVGSNFIGIGGPNLLPPEDSSVAAAVMVSPGGPAHVMLTDREAEHVPGCNMAFYRRALEEIGGFDPIFHKAGDDVDVCWRLQQRGYKVGFSPAAFVWHYRRSTVPAYLRQQSGYGEAEALLLRKHPEYFNLAGRSIWNGRIYSPSAPGVVLGHAVIYHGLFGGGLFQRLYTPAPAYALMFCTSLEYHALVTTPLLVLALALPWLWPLVLAALLLSLSVCALAAAQAELPRRRQRFWSRPLVAALFFLQPIERGLARYRTLLRFRPAPRAPERQVAKDDLHQGEVPEQLCFWSEGPVERDAFLLAIIHRLVDSQWHFRPDTGWMPYDLEILESRWSRLQLISATEKLDAGKMNLRCRLQTFWSLQAKVLFWGLFAFELAVVSFLAPVEPWIWMLLLSLPILIWFLEHEQSVLRKAVVDLVEEVARGHKLLAVPPQLGVPQASKPTQRPSGEVPFPNAN